MSALRGKSLPLSGSEPIFKTNPWGKSGLRVDNCYAYAMGDHARYRVNKSVPGNRSGMSNIPRTYTYCGDLAKRVISDNPGKVKLVRPNARCLKNFYKVMMFVAPTNSYGNTTGDFHFYKQHGLVDYKIQRGDTPTKLARFFQVPISRIITATPTMRLKVGQTIRIRANVFSHKMGWATGPLLVDAKGKVIKDPRKANRNYEFHYSKFCSAFCVKNKGIDVDPNRKKRMSLQNIFN